MCQAKPEAVDLAGQLTEVHLPLRYDSQNCLQGLPAVPSGGQHCSQTSTIALVQGNCGGTQDP